MNLIGNPKTANKFYIRLKDGGIEYVNTISTARMYVNDPHIESWYKQDVYATNENVIKGKDNKLYLESEIPEDLIKSDINHFIQFKTQAEEYIKSTLLKKVQSDGFDSLEEVYSWKDSSIIQFNQYCLKLFEYRDKCYVFYLNLLENNKSLLEKGKDINKINELYKYFIEKFPKLPDKKYF